LGIKIEPNGVLLELGIKDGYVWKSLPEKEYLFTK
jgi:hypothetical protein